MAITRPVNLTKPFADAAGVGYVRTIPEASQIGITPGAASLTDGFPPLNFLDPTAGGVPPSGQDMNGILKILSQHTAFQGSGGCYRFDSALSTAMGGYPVGAVLQGNTGVSSYINILAGNTTDFNSTPASIGVSWMPYGGAFQATETIPGKAELATQAETNAGTDDLRIVTPLKLRFGFTVSLTGNGYIKFPTWMGGLIIQWGLANPLVSPGRTITFPLAYPTYNFGVVTGGLDGFIVSCVIKTLADFYFITNATATGVNAWWISIGY